MIFEHIGCQTGIRRVDDLAKKSAKDAKPFWPQKDTDLNPQKLSHANTLFHAIPLPSCKIGFNLRQKIRRARVIGWAEMRTGF
jgi:hypothetical protein